MDLILCMEMRVLSSRNLNAYGRQGQFEAEKQNRFLDVSHMWSRGTLLVYCR